MTEFGHLGNPDVFPFSMLSNSNQKRRDEVNFLDAQLHGCLDPPCAAERLGSTPPAFTSVTPLTRLQPELKEAAVRKAWAQILRNLSSS